MSCQHIAHRRGDALHGGDVKKLVGPVGIRLWAEHTDEKELRIGHRVAQHAHERDGATDAT